MNEPTILAGPNSRILGAYSARMTAGDYDAVFDHFGEGFFSHVTERAHPESLDRAHLAMLHALITFKLFDDGDVLIPPRQLAGVVRWPGLDERRRPLALSEI